MFWREARKRAVELYVKYDKSAAAVIRELGYPSNRETLRRWYDRYRSEIQEESKPRRKAKKHRYTKAEKMLVLEYYLEHGCNQTRTVQVLGYPSRNSLNTWCKELLADTRKLQVGGVEWDKEEAPYPEDTPRSWEEAEPPMPLKQEKENERLKKASEKLKADIEELQKQYEERRTQLEALEQEIRQRAMETAIWEKAAEIIKKDLGVDPKNFSNREKTLLIGALRSEYPLRVLLPLLAIAESSYHYHRKRLATGDKYEAARCRIKELFAENRSRYGYRRIHLLLGREGTRISEKVVRRLMAEETLVAVGKRKKKFNAYRGEDFPAADNVVARDFHAEEPNCKWLTDITEFSIPAGRIYLSPLLDCFDGQLPSWAIGTNADAELVNTMLDRGIKTLKKGERPLVHSDRAFHYRWPGWLARMEKAGLVRSMSRKACSGDNAACEGLFGRLKNEMFYGRSWEGVSLDEFIKILNDYLVWYNEKRIKVSLGGMSPLEYRKSLGFSI